MHIAEPNPEDSQDSRMAREREQLDSTNQITASENAINENGASSSELVGADGLHIAYIDSVLTNNYCTHYNQ